MALKNLWCEQRQQRQLEVAQRHQKVSASLAMVRQTRQDRATQLRNTLSRFRKNLAQNNQMRHQEFLRFQADLHQFCQALQEETQQFLSTTEHHRHAQAQRLAQQLDNFVQTLHQQTAQFLGMTESERLDMAQQLTQELQTFHKDLRAMVMS